MWGATREAAGVALQSIRANKLRAALTMLGIIIGVAAVIAMVALGSGAQRAIDERISALGANLVSVYPGQYHVRGVASDLRAPLVEDDARALARDAVLIRHVVPEMQQMLQLEHPGGLVDATADLILRLFAQAQENGVEHLRHFAHDKEQHRSPSLYVPWSFICNV